MASLRLMTWNILEGFHSPRSDNPVEPPTWDVSRLQAAQKLIRKINPDILVLNEALWCRPVGGHHVNYAQVLGFEHQHADIYDGVGQCAAVQKSSC